MEAGEYQKRIAILIEKVGNYSTKSFEERLSLNTMGLVGEAGEIANKVKKHQWYSPQGTEELREDLLDEIGDVLYHVSQLSMELGYTLLEVMDKSVLKSETRAVNKPSYLTTREDAILLLQKAGIMDESGEIVKRYKEALYYKESEE